MIYCLFTLSTGGLVGPRVAEDFAANGIRSPELTVCSESLYRLRYPGPTPKHVSVSNLHFRHVLLQVYIVSIRRQIIGLCGVC